MMFFQQDSDTASGVDPTGAAGKAYEPTEFDAAATISDAYDKPLSIFSQLIGQLDDLVGVGAIGKAVVDLDTKSAELIKVLGVGQQRAAELTGTIAEAIPQYMALGLDAADVTKNYKSVINELKQNVALTSEQLVKLGAAAKVTGLEAGKMVNDFRAVGVPLDAIESKMMEIVEVSQQTGVILGSVAAGVSTNLGKLNTFNFEGGVKGLAQMSAQSARLGISMKQIFDKADEFLNPEKAIEFSSALQMLGVTSSQLLDPLRVMDLSLNDPKELQNQFAAVGKEFVKFNEQNNQFEILPGSKLRMREVAKQLGMTAEEFASMSLKAADFDRKLKAVEFSPNIAEEDRELVASMSQISKDGIAQVKVTTKNEKGEEVDEFVDVSKLTKDQILELKKQQELQGKSMEEVAKEQLGVLESINTGINKMATSVTYGVASSKSVQSRFTGDGKQVSTKVRKIGEQMDVKTVRSKVGSVESAAETLMNTLKEYAKNIPGIESMIQGTTNFINSSLQNLGVIGGGGSNQQNVNTANNTYSNQNIVQTRNQNTENVSAPQNITLNHNFNFSNLPDYITSPELQNILKRYIENPQNAFDMVASYQKINAGLSKAQ